MFSLRRSVGTGIVAVFPGKFLKSLRNRASYRVGDLFGGTQSSVRYTEPLGFVQDARYVMVLFDEWFEWLGVLGLCSVPVHDDTPVCHDYLVNGTGTFIINISSRHGC